MHRSVFTMIIVLSAYLVSLRLSGSWRESLLLVGSVLLLWGRILSVVFECLETSDREQNYPALWFLPVNHGSILDYLLVLCVLLVPVRAPTCCFLCFVCVLSVVSLFSLRFWTFFQFCSFLRPLKPVGFRRCGGQDFWKRIMLGALCLAMLGRISVLFLFILLLQLAAEL